MTNRVGSTTIRRRRKCGKGPIMSPNTVLAGNGAASSSATCSRMEHASSPSTYMPMIQTLLTASNGS